MRKRGNKVDVAVIFTCYNEDQNLKDNITIVKDVLDDTKYRWELILYDDDSKDKTPKIFKEFAKKDKRIKAFFQKANKGRGGTVKDAIGKSSGDVVGYLDTDLELSPFYIPEFVRKIKSGYDVAIANRIYTVGATNLTRAVASKAYVNLVRRLLGIKLNDTEAGFKFFNRQKIIPILELVNDNRWFFDTEVVARSVWGNLNIAEVPVLYMYNPEKKSSVNLTRDTIVYLKKLYKLRSEKKNK